MWARTYKTMLLTMNGISDTLSAYATAQTIYWKFSTTLTTNQFKFVPGSLSRILDALVMNAICFTQIIV